MNEVPKGIVPVVSHNAERQDKSHCPLSCSYRGSNYCYAREREEAEQDARMQRSPPTSVEPAAFNASVQEKSSVDEKSREATSEEYQVGPDGRYLLDRKGPIFPSDTYETDDRAKKVLADLQREQKSRVQNPSQRARDVWRTV